jgi:hypothetical protein
MPLSKLLGQFGIAPRRIEDSLDVIGQEIGKRLPRWRIVQRHADCDHLMVAGLEGNDRSPETLLFLSDSFVSRVSRHDAHDCRGQLRATIFINSDEATTTFLEF